MNVDIVVCAISRRAQRRVRMYRAVRNGIFFSAAILIGGARPGMAQAAPDPFPQEGTACDALATGQELSLQLALRVALCKDPSLKEATASVDRRVGELTEARAAYYPNIVGALGRTRDDQGYTGLPASRVSNNSARISLEWKLFDFGERDANVQAAAQLLNESLLSKSAAFQQAVADFTDAYFAALTARAYARAKQDMEDYARETLSSVERRRAAGLVGIGEYEQANSALLHASLDRNRANSAADHAEAILRIKLGLQPGAQVNLPPLEFTESATQARPLDEWLKAVQASHPSIQAAKAGLAAAEQQLRAARTSGMPSASLSIAHYRNGRPEQSLNPYSQRETTVGIAINIPIFDGFLRSARVKQASADVARSEAQLAEARDRVTQDFVGAFIDARASFGDVKLALDLNDSARHALESMRRRYEKGASDLSEVLSVQTTLANAVDEKIKSLAEWRSARFHLLTAAAQFDLDQKGSNQ